MTDRFLQWLLDWRAWTVVAYLVLGGVAALSSGQPTPSKATPPAKALSPDQVLQKARAFYDSRPYFQQPMPHTEVPQGLPDLRAETCGGCHTEIYEEWRISTHRRAWTQDAQFQAELAKSRSENNPDSDDDVGWMCVNCHTPLESQLERLVVGLEGGAVEKPIYIDNPNYDRALQLEAITCATCHVRDGAVLGPDGDTDAPHAVRKAPALLSVDVCTRCHQARAEFRHIALACVFDTGGEWQRGPYDDQGRTCQSCHMPEVTRPLMAGFPERKTRRHWFGGSLIPKKPEFAAELKPLEKIYPDGLAARWVDLPEAVSGGPVTLTFEAYNAEAGHLLPTGDPERFILLKAQVLGPDGATLAEREVRFGTRYQWHPQVKKLDDTRLKPRERRRYTLVVGGRGGGERQQKVDPPAKGPLTLRLVASKWRISEKNMQYHDLEGRYVAGRTFLDETRTLPVRPTKTR